MQTFKNDISNSPFKTIAVFPTEDCGALGPRIVAFYENSTYQDFPRHRAAEFLNLVTGREKDFVDRTISLQVEFQVRTQLNDVLVLKDNKYIYTGPEYTSQEIRTLVEVDVALIDPYDEFYCGTFRP